MRVGAGLRCADCSRALEPQSIGAARGFRCPEGHGALFTLGALRRVADPAGFDALWRPINGAAGRPGPPCPSCRHPLDQKTPEAGLCKRCQALWLPESLVQRLADEAATAAAQGPPPEDPARRAALLEAEALLAAERMRGEADRQGVADDLELVESVVGLLGDAVGLSRLPRRLV